MLACWGFVPIYRSSFHEKENDAIARHRTSHRSSHGDCLVGGPTRAWVAGRGGRGPFGDFLGIGTVRRPNHSRAAGPIEGSSRVCQRRFGRCPATRESLLTQDPASGPAPILAAQAAAGLGHIEEAVALFERTAAAEGGDGTDVLVAAGELLLQNGRASEAEQVLRRASGVIRITRRRTPSLAICCRSKDEPGRRGRLSCEL